MLGQRYQCPIGLRYRAPPRFHRSPLRIAGAVVSLALDESSSGGGWLCGDKGMHVSRVAGESCGKVVLAETENDSGAVAMRAIKAIDEEISEVGRRGGGEETCSLAYSLVGRRAGLTRVRAARCACRVDRGYWTIARPALLDEPVQ